MPVIAKPSEQTIAIRCDHGSVRLTKVDISGLKSIWEGRSKTR
jgi:hypothetical protein